jgi:hypothetical protein
MQKVNTSPGIRNILKKAITDLTMGSGTYTQKEYCLWNQEHFETDKYWPWDPEHTHKGEYCLWDQEHIEKDKYWTFTTGTFLSLDKGKKALNRSQHQGKNQRI